ncbi:hypothetical protein [Hyalangium versicolor]|uniref:hypothetical protein n=1 Tax=Hyalangium versicolor TaxID=2861190 RepID=UPI001CC9F544|nr:hypothetical protein [Hyalangium versicolor]
MSSYKPVTLLYEDQGGIRKEFGLHNLVIAMVNDLLGNDFSRLKREALKDGRPLKGNAKLLQEIKDPRQLDRLMGHGRPVIAVFDADKPPLPSDELKKLGTERLHICLLESNMETVIQASADCEPTLAQDLITSALRHKDLNSRDRILNRLAFAPHSQARDCVRGKVPSLSSLCELVVRLVRG